VKNVKELISHAKTNKLTFASAGNGSSNHLTGELLKSMAGIDIMHVPYKGDGPAMNDVIGGQVSMMFATVVAALPHIKSGKVRAIGLATPKPTAALPGVAPIADSGVPDFDSSSWGGILAPAGTPKEVIGKLHEGTVKILKMPDVEQRMSSLGADVVASTPQQFGEYIKSETSKWAKVVKESGAAKD
jgi:tripartite-type tricarboxylate transporter receptor subunit TctC